MTQQKLFYRKIVYIIVIAALLFPLYRMGNPAQRTAGGTLSQGGTLAQMRAQNGLAEANLGQIDPASSTMKLATFGMRGVAVALLWNRSLDYEKKADWMNVVATGNQIIMLEPHFISIWDFVGWKLAYNASAQYDDYRERYRWVIRGFEFIQKGTTYNQTAPKLFQKAGWTISQKIGIADEKNQYRRLFREDDEFHDKQVYKERDNWLFGRNFYQVAEDLFEKGGDIGKETRCVFYSRSRMNLLRYAEWMEIDGCGITKDNTPVFDEEHTAAAWNNAAEQWFDFCKIKMKTVIEDKTKKGEFREMALNDYKECETEIKELTGKIEAMLPDGKMADSILWDRWNNLLTDQQRGAMYDILLDPVSEYDPNLGRQDAPLRKLREFLDGKHGEQPEWANWREKLHALKMSLYEGELRQIAEKPWLFRSEEEFLKLKDTEDHIVQWAEQGRLLLNVTPYVMAEMVEGDAQLEAKDFCDRITELGTQMQFSSMYRDIMDCARHDRRVVLEPTAEAREARKLRYQARTKFYSGQHEEASDDFLASMTLWTKATDRPEFADIMHMPQFTSVFLNEVDKYSIILDQLERLFPDNYAFEPLVRREFRKNRFDTISSEAVENLRRRIADGGDDKITEDAEKLLNYWPTYFQGTDYAPLMPLPEVRSGITEAVRLFAEAWETRSETDLKNAVESGIFDEYPLKNELALLITKSEPLYAEIQKSDLAALTDPDNALAHLEKSTGLWGQMLEKYPILKYDRSSEFRPQIQKDAAGYLEKLKEKGSDKPENFPLESFLQ